uniref:Uncharacterized protein n=1 Tax=Glossina palpalis gambiensis TaxID=67801 RepID=A0A1B0BU59_9MUSC
MFATTDFGIDRVKEVEDIWNTLRSVQPNGPLVNSEFYPGWPTHWQEPNQRRDANAVAKVLRPRNHSSEWRVCFGTKICEVYFIQLNKKIFDVALNRRHVIVSQLDIFAEMGHGTAHHAYIFFTVNLGKLKYKEKVSNLRNNLVRFDFMIS